MLACFFAVCLIGSEQGTTPLPLFPEKTYLVRGRVIEAKDTRTNVVNKVRIQHVYNGGSDVKGETFLAYSADSPIGNATNVAIPRLHIGDTGIWLVSKSNGAFWTENWYNYMRWPVREAGGPAWAPPYVTIKAFAEAVERVSQLPGQNEAAAALKRLATDPNPYISSWAVARLPAVSQRADDVSDVLRTLLGNERVPIQGQVALDRALQGEADMEGSLVVRPNPGWHSSEARLNLFRRWFTGALSKRDAYLVVTRLDETAQHPASIGFPQEELLKLAVQLIRNDRFPMSERQRASTIVMWAARRYESDEQPFAAAVKIVGSNLPEEVRRGVAAVFTHDFVMNDERRQRLAKLRDAETAKSVSEVLEMALARPNGKPR